jgi:hypothetical protein
MVPTKYYSGDQVKKNVLSGIARIGESKRAYRVLVGKPEG